MKDITVYYIVYYNILWWLRVRWGGGCRQMASGGAWLVAGGCCVATGAVAGGWYLVSGG